MKIMLRVAMLLAFAITFWAQDTPKTSKTKSPKSEAQSMPMPKPAPEMTKLVKKMQGNWTTAEKMEPGPMAPNGGSGKGTASFTTGPGGMSMMEKYRSSGGMGNFSGFGSFWWDSKAQGYKGVWCDNMTPDGCDSSGTTKWEGDNLVGTSENEMNGQKMVTKFTYSDFKPNSFVMTMESGPDANSLKKMMTITYTKAGAAAPAADKPGQ